MMRIKRTNRYVINRGIALFAHTERLARQFSVARQDHALGREGIVAFVMVECLSRLC
jgi:hypothetical protein